MKYFEVCKEIWNQWVPQRGQSQVLQGELLRQIEKLRYEGQKNQNANWCDDHRYFCDFLRDNLCQEEALSPRRREAVRAALVRLKSCGEVARRYHLGEITDQELKEDYNGELAYPDSDLYDLVCDAVAKFYQAYPDPIPYQPLPHIRH